MITSAVITGRGTMRLNGVRLPWRFRFTHEAGQNYRHYIEVAFFGLPLMKINEYYVDGKERMEMPWGRKEGSLVQARKHQLQPLTCRHCLPRS